MGWASTRNGELLTLAEGQRDAPAAVVLQAKTDKVTDLSGASTTFQEIQELFSKTGRTSLRPGRDDAARRFVMTRQQRFKHEMFVRVRHFGAGHAGLFPESSRGGRAFARVSSAVAEIDEHMKNHVLGRAGARRVKAATRGAV